MRSERTAYFLAQRDFGTTKLPSLTSSGRETAGEPSTDVLRTLPGARGRALPTSAHGKKPSDVTEIDQG
jgi:hypothetical protein